MAVKLQRRRTSSLKIHPSPCYAVARRDARTSDASGSIAVSALFGVQWLQVKLEPTG